MFNGGGEGTVDQALRRQRTGGVVDRDPLDHRRYLAQAVQDKLMLLRGPPWQTLGQLVMIEDVEQAHAELEGGQGPQQR